MVGRIARKIVLPTQAGRIARKSSYLRLYFQVTQQSSVPLSIPFPAPGLISVFQNRIAKACLSVSVDRGIEMQMDPMLLLPVWSSSRSVNEHVCQPGVFPGATQLRNGSIFSLDYKMPRVKFVTVDQQASQSVHMVVCLWLMIRVDASIVFGPTPENIHEMTIRDIHMLLDDTPKPIKRLHPTH